MSGRLDGQVAVVTGSGRGLGRAYAMALAAEGAKVVINDRDKEPTDDVVREITAAGGTAAPCYEPVGDQAAAAAIVRTAVDTFGQIDVMVTNAGADRRGFILDLTPDDWEFTLRTHLFGSIHCSVEAAKAMRDRGQGGAIINVTSDAFYSAPVQLAPYCASKGGIYGLMLSLSVELAPLGISVNAIAPPATRTGPMLAYVDTLASMMTKEQVEGFKSMIEEPEDVAPLVVFFATPEGRKLSGHVLTLTHDELTVLRPPSHPDAPVRAGSGPWTLDDLLTAVPNLV